MMLSNETLIAKGFQIDDGIVSVGSGVGLKSMLRAGQQWLELHLNIVNDLNVFPVPDGDTGTNMLLTIRSALEEMEGVAVNEAGAVAAAVARGALMGARGNSGVILSQFLEGLALSLSGHPIFTADDLARAFRLGVEKAYQSVITPVEGTILTVARKASEAAQQSVTTNKDLLVLLKEIVKAARTAQSETPELLPALKEAGVTDAGGQGLLYILEGALRYMSGEPVDSESANGTGFTLPATLRIEEETYGYDVQFLIRGEGLDIEDIRAYIDSAGWSAAVVGDPRTVKVHVHTNDPGWAISYGASKGRLGDVVIEDMADQARRFVDEHALKAAGAKSATALVDSSEEVSKIGEALTNTAIVCVAPGKGLVKIFQSLGVSQVLSGGQALKPSVRDLLKIIDQVEADNVIILPNNHDAIRVAEQAKALSSKSIRVVGTKTVPQGIAALLSFNYQATLDINAQHMLEEAQKVRTIEIGRAARNTRVNGFRVKTGDVIGFLDEALVSVGQDYNGVALEVLLKAQSHLSSMHEIATIYFGKDSTAGQAQSLAQNVSNLYPELKVEILNGGQPHYHYIMSLE